MIFSYYFHIISHLNVVIYLHFVSGLCESHHLILRKPSQLAGGECEGVLLFPEVELKGDNKRSGRNLDAEVTALDDESIAGGASCV